MKRSKVKIINELFAQLIAIVRVLIYNNNNEVVSS